MGWVPEGQRSASMNYQAVPNTAPYLTLGEEDTVTFEAPNKPSQFALLDHFGCQVRLSNVRLEELLRVEIYRRGLHSDAFCKDNLRPLRVPQKAA